MPTVSDPCHPRLDAPPPAQECPAPAVVEGVLPGFLGSIGLFGLERLELPLLAALAGGDPLLLVGGHGAAKTTLVRRISALMGLHFHVYDASKALFEDVIGFPDPTSFVEGRVRYLPTPLTIWDKEAVLVDELSRATPAMQNKWLEVIRARTIMGVRIEGLRHVFAAMNPPDYLGAGPLDPALAGRFAWILQAPDVGAMCEKDVLGIVRAMSSEDSPLLPRTEAGSVPPDLGARLRAFVGAVRARFPAVRAARGDEVACYVHELAMSLRASDTALDGRRLGMIHRNVLLGLAVHEVAGDLPADLDEPVREILCSSLAATASEEPVEETALFAAHASAHRSAFERQGPRRRPVSAILGERDPWRAVDRYIEAARDLSVEEHDRAVERFLSNARQASGPDRPAAYAVALGLVQAVIRRHEDFPAELVARLVGWAVRCSGVLSCSIGSGEDPEREGQPPRMDGSRAALAARLAVELCREHPGSTDDLPDTEQVDEMRTIAFREIGRLARREQG